MKISNRGPTAEIPHPGYASSLNSVTIAPSFSLSTIYTWNVND